MFAYLRSIFHPPTPGGIALAQLQDAERMLLLHTAAAEDHDAQALMLQVRIERLSAVCDKVCTGSLSRGEVSSLFTVYDKARQDGLGLVDAFKKARRRIDA